jgi:hypothetical protein
MSFSTKPLLTLALAVSMGPFAAQAHNVPHHNVVQSPQKSWVTNFGFLPANGKASSCTDVQTGFCPRPPNCKR